MKAQLVVMLACVAGCNSRTADTQHVRIGTTGFDLPADWQRSDTKSLPVLTSLWTPRDNERKESLTVTRSDENPALATAGTETLQRLLVSAQASLPEARASKLAPITSARGLEGVRVEVDFVPAGLHAHYRRVHAVLVDKQANAIVNVLYTARDPDLDAFNQVLNSIHHEEG